MKTLEFNSLSLNKKTITELDTRQLERIKGGMRDGGNEQELQGTTTCTNTCSTTSKTKCK